MSDNGIKQALQPLISIILFLKVHAENNSTKNHMSQI